MDLSLSSEELQKILKSDTGFNNYLKSLPDNQVNFFNQIFSDGDILVTLLKLLPENVRVQTEKILNSILHTPEKAMKLFDDCRFFEARVLLKESISLYFNKPAIAEEFLDKACAFVTKRANALLFNLLGEVEWELGNKERAEKNHRKALSLAEEVGDIDTIAKSLYGLGAYYWKQGDFENGLKFNHEALEAISGHQDRWHIQNKVLTNLCAIYSDLGQYEQSFNYGHKAVDLCETHEDSKGFPTCCNNLACLYLESGEFDLAIEFLDNGLSVAQSNNDFNQQVFILNNMAVCFLRHSPMEDNLEIANSLLSEAYSIVEKTDSKSLKAMTMFNMGLSYRISGEKNHAKKYFIEAIHIYREIGSKSYEAQALNRLGSLLETVYNDVEGAFNAYERSIDIVESIRGNLTKETHRITYADMIIEPYQQAIHCLLTLNQPEKAFAYVERAKSRTLMEFLSDKLLQFENFKKFPDLFEKATSLIKDIDEIQMSLEAIQHKEESGFYTGVDKSKYIEIETHKQSLLNELEKKENAFSEIYSRLLERTPEMTSLISATPLPKNGFQIHSGDDTLVLNIFQAEKKLHIFIRFPDNFITAFAVEISMDEAFEFVRNQINAIRNPENLNIRSHEYLRDVQQPMTKMYDRLFTHLEPLFSKYNRIIISPHLFWHYFPFHALYNKKNKAYLCDQMEIGYCPSVSVLHYCMAKNQLCRDKAIILSQNKGDLKHVDKEAELIAASFHSPGNIFSGEDAYLDQIGKGGTDYDVIHLACHGYFNQDQPFLSGIDIPPEKSGEGRTYLLDFLKLNLNCNLMTISACESGLNLYTSADELIGLSRSIFCAGAASIMLSLWKVVDESTCHIMENFYWHYIQNRQTKTRALQLAMQAVKAKPEYAHPYFWAPFNIMGDWR